MHLLSVSNFDDERDQPTSLGTTPDRRRLPGAHVHRVRADRTFPQGVREEQLPQREVGSVSYQSERIVPSSRAYQNPATLPWLVAYILMRVCLGQL